MGSNSTSVGGRSRSSQLNLVFIAQGVGAGASQRHAHKKTATRWDEKAMMRTLIDFASCRVQLKEGGHLPLVCFLRICLYFTQNIRAIWQRMRACGRSKPM